MVNKPLFKEIMMNKILRIAVLAATIGIPFSVAQASRDGDTANLFRDSDQSSAFFQKSYGYAVFPTIGKGGLGIGAAHGSGHVYAYGRRIGRVTMTQLSVGWQAGGEAYSEIIFFQDKQSMDAFTAISNSVPMSVRSPLRRQPTSVSARRGPMRARAPVKGPQQPPVSSIAAWPFSRSPRVV